VPVGFVAFDLDYYSSTKSALSIFEGSAATHLPRVHCYFDDVSSNDVACMNPYVGFPASILQRARVAEITKIHNATSAVVAVRLVPILFPSRQQPHSGRVCAQHSLLRLTATAAIGISVGALAYLVVLFCAPLFQRAGHPVKTTQNDNGSRR